MSNVYELSSCRINLRNMLAIIPIPSWFRGWHMKDCFIKQWKQCTSFTGRCNGIRQRFGFEGNTYERWRASAMAPLISTAATSDRQDDSASLTFYWCCWAATVHFICIFSDVCHHWKISARELQLNLITWSYQMFSFNACAGKVAASSFYEPWCDSWYHLTWYDIWSINAIEVKYSTTN